MFSLKLRGVLASLVAVGALALPASALARDPVEWEYGYSQAQAAQPVPGSHYNLIDYQRYRHDFPSPAALMLPNEIFAGGGSHLDWAADAPNWTFVRQAVHPRTAAITGTERVALAYGSIYLVYEHNTFGVSLGWSTTPSYQWQVASGTRGAGGGLLELYNTQEQAYLVYDNQTFGIDLDWLHAPFGLPAGYVAPPSLIPPIAPSGGSLQQPPPPPPGPVVGTVGSRAT